MGLPAKVISMEEHRKPSPQLEDGYIRIANELFDAILEKLASYRHTKVVLAILRKTYGYQKKEDDITISQLAEMTGIHRNNVGAALKELEQMRVINPVRAGSHGLMKADACLATGGERGPGDRPFCYTGAKGLLQVRLRADGANQSLPPGLAASVPNPLWRLVWALGQIKSDQEEVLVEGFYDDVEGPSRAENQVLRSLAMDEAGRKRAWNLKQFLFDLDGAALVRAEATLPTCNVTDLVVEPASDVPLIPVTATARVDFQLVPRQHPQTIADLLRAHLVAKGMDDIVVERLPGGYPAVHTPFDHAFIQLLGRVGAELYTAPLSLLPHGPFVLPLFFFAEALRIPVAAIGCARPDSAISAANERIPLPDLIRHGQLLIDLLYACAAE